MFIKSKNFFYQYNFFITDNLVKYSTKILFKRDITLVSMPTKTKNVQKNFLLLNNNIFFIRKYYRSLERYIFLKQYLGSSSSIHQMFVLMLKKKRQQQYKKHPPYFAEDVIEYLHYNTDYYYSNIALNVYKDYDVRKHQDEIKETYDFIDNFSFDKEAVRFELDIQQKREVFAFFYSLLQKKEILNFLQFKIDNYWLLFFKRYHQYSYLTLHYITSNIYFSGTKLRVFYKYYYLMQIGLNVLQNGLKQEFFRQISQFNFFYALDCHELTKLYLFFFFILLQMFQIFYRTQVLRENLFIICISFIYLILFLQKKLILNKQ